MTTKNQTSIKVEPGKQELFITREFDAPREVVFKAFTDPKILVRWLGLRDHTMRVEKMDPKGAWKFVHSDSKGNEFAFHGMNHETLFPERLIRTFEFDGLPETGHVILETARFEAISKNRTRVVVQSVFQSVQDRDGMVASGMERGVNDSHEKLDEILAEG